MRLLNVGSLEFAEFHRDSIPKYVIASHRWVSGFEASFKNFQERRNVDGIGYKKVESFARYVREEVRPPVEWLWIDTCCIDQTNAAELSEAINLMFEWYRNAELCIVYLADVKSVDDKSSLEQSEWFQRGWTLQELLAPRTVVFVTKAWQVIGNKGASAHGYNRTTTGPGLETDIAAITKIPERVLHDYGVSLGLTVDERLKWMEGRKTAREEDLSYALYGIFNVTPGANYGERRDGARQRLLGAIRQQEDLMARQVDYFRKIVNWLSAPDPWTNHTSARERHHPNTGAWLLQSDRYRRWRDGTAGHLWLCGKPGCGKTVLCSSVVEDIREYCGTSTNIGHATFYFSFSDAKKQSSGDLLRSLVAQLSWVEPGFSMLRQAHEASQSVPSPAELERILLSSARSYNAVFVTLDALDECPEVEEKRQNVLQCLGRLVQTATNIKIFVTSRDLPDIRSSMATIKVERAEIATQSVNGDIRDFVTAEMLRDWRLARLDDDMKVLIEETISQRADGMFRWAYCQLWQLKKLKSTKPKHVKQALLDLPASLDETYERMLVAIGDELREEAVTLLRWVAYARSPPSLGELVKASIIDVENGSVDMDERGGLEDVLDILAGLVTTEEINDRGRFDNCSHEKGIDTIRLGDLKSSSDQIDKPRFCRQLRSDTKVRLAHYSVQEYLESDRISGSDAKHFHFSQGREHGFLAKSCLAYILHYSQSPGKTATENDLSAFPMLQYATQSWFYHSSLQQFGSVSYEISLLGSTKATQDWLRVYQPDQEWDSPFAPLECVGPGLYYASFLGLEEVAKILIDSGADVNAEGGICGSALQAASEGGLEKVIQMLIDYGADVNAQGGHYGNALQAASEGGHEKVIRILMDNGADVNAQGGHYGNALQAASERGYEKVIRMLIDYGADVNAQGGHYGNALQAAAASYEGHEKVVQMLIDGGADANAQGGFYGNALQAASERGHAKAVQMLIDRGLDVNAQGGFYGNALQAAAASGGGHEKVIQILMDNGADVNAQGGLYGNALQAASERGHEKIVQMLIDGGADVNAQGGLYSNALQAASEGGHERIVQMLIDGGADVNAQGEYGNALQAASEGGHEKVVQMLIDGGAIGKTTAAIEWL